MSRTNRNRLTFHPEWIGLVPIVWIKKSHKNQGSFRLSKEHRSNLPIGPGGPNCPCCFDPRGKRNGKFRSLKRKSELRWRRESFDF